MRLNRAGAIGGAVYLGLGLLWLLFGNPPGPGAIFLAWFVVLAVAGIFVPGAANQVSLARAYLAAPALAYSITLGHLGLLAVAVAVAGLTDLVDGTVARRFDKPSALGGGLDPVVDGVFLGALAVGLSIGGAFPLWLAVVIVLRYLLPALAGGMLLALGRRPELRHTLMGQVSTTLNLVLVGGVCLLRGLGQEPGRLVAGAEVAIPVATVATFIHLAWASTRRRPVAAPEPG